MSDPNVLFAVEKFTEPIPKKLRNKDRDESTGNHIKTEVIIQPPTKRSRLFKLEDSGQSDSGNELEQSDDSELQKKKHEKLTGISDSDSDNEGYKQVTTSKKAQRDEKAELIAKLLCRWWYVLPPWPPKDYDYAEILKQKKLKQVSLFDWETADDIDSKGFAKVYEISNFPGVFRDAQGNALDLRPLKDKPCFSTFKNYSNIELYKLLKTALQAQLEKLKHSPFTNTDLSKIEELKNTLKQVQRLVY